MKQILTSTTFLLTTIVLDVILLTLINSTAIPVQGTPLLAGFILLVLSPGLAYLLVWVSRRQGRDSTESKKPDTD